MEHMSTSDQLALNTVRRNLEGVFTIRLHQKYRIRSRKSTPRSRTANEIERLRSGACAPGPKENQECISDALEARLVHN